MKQKLLFLMLTFFAIQGFAQQKILVADRRIKVSYDPIDMVYAFQKGDKQS